MIKIKSVYFQVIQNKTDKRPRTQKLQSTFKAIEIVKTVNKTIAEILENKHSNLFEINHPIYSTAISIAEEINGI
jgi:hypothetical protein